MPRIGLALSGGGFRATLYHLGVVRYLKDTGQLQHVTSIASVSGGSILAAHLALNWERYTGEEARFEEAVAEVVKFVQFDVRNYVVRRLPPQYLMRQLARFSALDAGQCTPNAVLERLYRDLLYGDRCLHELPLAPQLHILATNISNGGLSVFNREGLYIQERGATDSSNFKHVPGQMATLPRVVGASSAFPGLFPPVKITAADLGVREGEFPTEFFTDGGVYDNLGIRAFTWLKQRDCVFDQIIVSDAGKPFQILADGSLGFVAQSMRASDILWDRVWQLERQNFGERPGFVFLPITESVLPEEDPTALPLVVQAEVQTIRTDLDCFSVAEINTLAQHGYEVARKCCRAAGIDLANTAQLPPWAPIPNQAIHAQEPSSRPMAPSPATRLSRELRSSAVRRVWSTLLNPRDWISYAYVALALLAFVWAPWRIYELYRQSQLQAMVIDAIAAGDPDIRRVLDLVHTDPLVNWSPAIVREASEPSKIDYTGIELLTYSRIIDLRNWQSDTVNGEKGYAYICDRVTLRFLETYKGNRRITFAFPTPTENVEFRQQGSDIHAAITHIARPYEEHGEKLTLFELEYDLTRVPLGQSVTLQLEGLVRKRGHGQRAPFVNRAHPELLSVWMLFPADRPYRTYSLVRYPVDRSAPPALMESRYTIDHPYGSLIGWSVVNPHIDTVYECRWTTE